MSVNGYPPVHERYIPLTKGSNPPSIVVLGSINMDLVGTVERPPLSGETVTGRGFHTSPGGKGANQAVAAARLGAMVKMVGKVGMDAFGPVLLTHLESNSVNVAAVTQAPDLSSGVAMILLDSCHQNQIVVVGGANAACGDDQVAAAKQALDGADALLLQLEIPMDVSLAAARYAKSIGARVIWDPAPVQDLPPEVFSATDILTPNEVEASSLTGIEVNDPDSARAAVGALLDRGVGTAIVKLGGQGVFYASGDDAGYLPAFSVEAVDTVAAGDAFGAGLAVGLAEGYSLLDAVKFGSAAGALAVTRAGAQEAMPYRRDVEALLARG